MPVHVCRQTVGHFYFAGDVTLLSAMGLSLRRNLVCGDLQKIALQGIRIVKRTFPRVVTAVECAEDRLHDVLCVHTPSQSRPDSACSMTTHGRVKSCVHPIEDAIPRISLLIDAHSQTYQRNKRLANAARPVLAGNRYDSNKPVSALATTQPTAHVSCASLAFPLYHVIYCTRCRWISASFEAGCRATQERTVSRPLLPKDPS